MFFYFSYSLYLIVSISCSDIRTEAWLMVGELETALGWRRSDQLMWWYCTKSTCILLFAILISCTSSIKTIFKHNFQFFGLALGFLPHRWNPVHILGPGQSKAVSTNITYATSITAHLPLWTTSLASCMAGPNSLCVLTVAPQAPPAAVAIPG